MPVRHDGPIDALRERMGDLVRLSVPGIENGIQTVEVAWRDGTTLAGRGRDTREAIANLLRRHEIIINNKGNGNG